MNPTMHPTEPEKAQHTAEPLRTDTDHDGRHHCLPIMAGDGESMPYHPLIAVVYHGRGHAPRAVAEATAKRLVSCYNACASIPDPASAVPALVGALERALKIEEARLEDRRQLFFEDELDGDAEYCAIRDNRDEYRAALALAKGGKR